MTGVPEEAIDAAEARWQADAEAKVVAHPRIHVTRLLNAAAPFMCMALADAEVAAERQRLHDRIEGLADDVAVIGTRESWLIARALRALVSEASASSPVSDDTGGTKP